MQKQEVVPPSQFSFESLLFGEPSGEPSTEQDEFSPSESTETLSELTAPALTEWVPDLTAETEPEATTAPVPVLPEHGQPPRKRADTPPATKVADTKDASDSAGSGEALPKADLARKQAEEGIAALAAELSAGHSAGFLKWLDTMSRFHSYSLNNTLLIAMQRPEATHVAGFHTWKSVGRTVKKGEKGILILAPIAKRVKKADRGDSRKKSCVYAKE